jgi:hypothetical protein
MRVLTIKLASLILCSQVLHFDSETEKTDRLALVDFLKGLLEFDPNKRWSPVQVCHCYWHNFILHSSYWPSSIIKLY